MNTRLNKVLVRRWDNFWPFEYQTCPVLRSHYILNAKGYLWGCDEEYQKTEKKRGAGENSGKAHAHGKQGTRTV